MTNLRIEHIERKTPVTIKVNGKSISAFTGETVLSALIAAGYKILRKSPVAGEPRGALCGMGICYECLVTVNGIPNVRACMEEVEENMEIMLDENCDSKG